MTQCTVLDLTLHPVKSLRGQSVDVIEFGPMGIRGDRDLMIVRDGKPLIQHDEPRMARTAAAWLEDGRLELRHEEERFVHEVTRAGDPLATQLHYNEIETCDQGDAVAGWLSEALDGPARLVSLPKPWDRWIPLPAFEDVDGRPQDRFYDASPVLVNIEASIDDLNSRLETPIPANRFRGNVLLSGLPAYAEDSLTRLHSDELDLAKVSVCERCVVITTDQETGERNKEPLKTLNGYRRRADGYASGIVFGAYMRIVQPGRLKRGATLEASSEPAA